MSISTAGTDELSDRAGSGRRQHLKQKMRSGKLDYLCGRCKRDDESGRRLGHNAIFGGAKVKHGNVYAAQPGGDINGERGTCACAKDGRRNLCKRPGQRIAEGGRGKTPVYEETEQGHRQRRDGSGGIFMN